MRRTLPDIRVFEPYLLACLPGLAIAWVDSRPGWDDTGVTAGALLFVSAVIGFIFPRWPWRWGLAVGIWVPLAGLILNHNPGSLIALLPAMLGAYLGGLFRRKK